MSKPDFAKRALDLTTYGHPFTTGDYDDFDICAVCRRDVRRHLSAGKTQVEEIEFALRKMYQLGEIAGSEEDR